MPTNTKTRLTVAFISPTLGMGGAEATIVNLCKAWQSRDEIDVVCIGLTDGAATWQPFVDAAVAAGVPVYAAESRHATLTNAQHNVTRFADPFEPIRRAATADIVIHWGLPQIGELLSAVGFTGRSVSWGHGSIEFSRRLAAAAESGSTHFAAVSAPAADAQPAGRREETAILWNGIDLDRLTQTTTRETTRAKWGASPDEMLIGYVGRLSTEKNPLAVGQAAMAIRNRYPEIKARPVWVGDGWEGEKFRRLGRDLAGDVGIWQPPTDQIGDALAALDVFVLASPGEGFSLSLTDAWAAGVPTVSTAVGAVPELENRFGPMTVRVPVDPTPEQLAEACLSAISPANRPTVQRAANVTREHFTAAAMAARWATWLKGIAK